MRCGKARILVDASAGRRTVGHGLAIGSDRWCSCSGAFMKCVGRAVTMRFVPARPDIAQDKPPGGDSPEYEAFEKCGPNEVLVMSSVGPWDSVGGDIKFLRLKQRQIGGLVTDGSVRIPMKSSIMDSLVSRTRPLLDRYVPGNGPHHCTKMMYANLVVSHSQPGASLYAAVGVQWCHFRRWCRGAARRCLWEIRMVSSWFRQRSPIRYTVSPTDVKRLKKSSRKN
jgi:hypothetical protein